METHSNKKKEPDVTCDGPLMTGKDAINIQKPQGPVHINTLLGRAGFIFRGTKNRGQLIVVMLFPFAMAGLSLISPEKPISRFDFWLMVPVLAISIAFYGTVFFTNLEDRAKVKSIWKRYRRMMLARASRQKIDLNPRLPLRWRMGMCIFGIILGQISIWFPPLFGIPMSKEFQQICIPLMVVVGAWYGWYMGRPNGPVESIQPHLPRHLRR